MTNNAYIVANKKQELDVLNKFEQMDLVWLSGDNSTEWILSENSLFNSHVSFPYALIEKEDKNIAWLAMIQLTDETIVYDGRKEENVFENVTRKYIVQRKDPVSRYGREYLYVSIDKSLKFVYEQPHATRFEDYMEAFEWAGIHFEVVEVDE